jgi:hypothetical protein
MKILPVDAELYHADRQTDGRTDRHEEANNRFTHLWGALKNEHSVWEP